MALTPASVRLKAVMTAVALMAVAIGIGPAALRRHSLLDRAGECKANAHRYRRYADYSDILAGRYKDPPETDLGIRDTAERLHALGTMGCVVFRTAAEALRATEKVLRLGRS